MAGRFPINIAGRRVAVIRCPRVENSGVKANLIPQPAFGTESKYLGKFLVHDIMIGRIKKIHHGPVMAGRCLPICVGVTVGVAALLIPLPIFISVHSYLYSSLEYQEVVQGRPNSVVSADKMTFTPMA